MNTKKASIKEVKRFQSLFNVTKRIAHCTSKDTKKIFKNATFDKLISACRKQNEIIDVCALYKCTVDETAYLLTQSSLCRSFDDAIKRVKRHKKNDIEHAIEARVHRLCTRANVSVSDI
jgi:hypothetical protein